MATIKRINGKIGPSFKITVTHGRDLNGKQVRHNRTWRPEPGMTERQMQKAVQRAAIDFEREIELGYQMDNRQTFAQYAEYVLELKERTGAKHKTIVEYKNLTKRIYPEIGHFKLNEIHPQHLNSLYKRLASSDMRKNGQTAAASIDLTALLKSRRMSRAKLAGLAGVAASTVSKACNGCNIAIASAERIAQALERPLYDLFKTERDSEPLASTTLLAYHRLIHMVLDQAEKEMLVPYNAADKATPPKLKKKDVNYFQPQQISAILDALEDEPLIWKTITHLLIVTGCRRGEIMGLKWDKIDFQTRRVCIDTTLLYTKDRGVYESTTKAGNRRFIDLPAETIALLKEYRREYLELRLKNGDRWQDTGYVFVRDDGRPRHPDSIGPWLSKFSKRRGLPHINPHAFRHTVASVLIANGTDVVTVSKQLGHLNVGTTEDFYSHIIEENKRRASECLADTLLRSRKA